MGEGFLVILAARWQQMRAGRRAAVWWVWALVGLGSGPGGGFLHPLTSGQHQPSHFYFPALPTNLKLNSQY